MWKMHWSWSRVWEGEVIQTGRERVQRISFTTIITLLQLLNLCHSLLPTPPTLQAPFTAPHSNPQQLHHLTLSTPSPRNPLIKHLPAPPFPHYRLHPRRQILARSLPMPQITRRELPRQKLQYQNPQTPHIALLARLLQLGRLWRLVTHHELLCMALVHHCHECILCQTSLEGTVQYNVGRFQMTVW